MRDIVDCDHWRDCKIDGGGCCAENRFSKPSTGVCNTLCKFKIRNGELKNPSGIGQYLTVELIAISQGPASEADAAARLAICMGCEHRATNYEGQTDTVGWCKRCICGSNARAKLSVKVTLAGASCPLAPAKWSSVPGTGATVASAVDAVAGVAKSIIHKLGGG